MVILSEFGAKLYGSRIYADFQRWSPKNGPREIGDSNVQEFTLMRSVSCVIIRPIKIKESENI